MKKNQSTFTGKLTLLALLVLPRASIARGLNTLKDTTLVYYFK